MAHFIPYPFSWDDMPLDISAAFPSSKPAGRHGFVQVKADKLVFADGRPARFWGVNFNSGANFPDFAYSEKTARRLAKAGVNLVRFHQLDAEWSTPNIFQFSRGPLLESTRSLDPESMKRLDYLIYCLKKEGIYCYLDLLTYRRFKAGDGVANAAALKDAAKPYSIFSDRLIELQKEYASQLWQHHNPYTGLAYKDDPVFVLTEITNECDFSFFAFDFKVEPYYSELVGKLQLWLAEQGLDYPAKDQPDFKNEDPLLVQFFMQLQEDYYLEMAGFMRDIGVKIPIAGTNWGRVSCASAMTQACLDFVDGHSYWWNRLPWGEFRKQIDHRQMASYVDTILPEMNFSCQLGKPFFVSEWDIPWPNDYRAEGPLFLAAVGSLQGWSGFTVHTYRYSSKKEQTIIGKEFAGSAVNNSVNREGVFATFNDPARFGLFYHAALIMRRADVKQAEQTVAIQVKEDELNLRYEQIEALRLVSEQHKVGFVYPGRVYEADQTINVNERLVIEKEGLVAADTGQLKRDWQKGIGRIDTARSKCLYGLLGSQGKQELAGLAVTVKNEFAVIALSSLNDQPISQSDNLLLTTVGRAENDGMQYSDNRQELFSYGQAPIMVELIEAKLSITTNQTNLRVLSIGPEGFTTGIIPSVYENGQLEFELGQTCPSMYYLIQTE